MGNRFLDLKLPTDYTDDDVKKHIKQSIGTDNFTYTLDKQSLDARQHRNIHWQARVLVESGSIKDVIKEKPPFELPEYKNDRGKMAVVGSGPAGFFAAWVGIQSGYDVTIFELGPEVFTRIKEVKSFEKGGPLNERANYAYGEGGAGTFSDGKLTSRTKSIAAERAWIFEQYITAGAPEEIRFLSKPHIGSNLLVKTAKNLRKSFIEKGGTIHFDTAVTGINHNGSKVVSIDTEQGIFEADHFVFAPGHSSYSTYKMLIEAGAVFASKPFAIGARIEHKQELINKAKWRQPELPGVKAADYSVTYNDAKLPVYSFCMCPGGMVVPAPPTKESNIVNGMSNYKRNYPYSNSAIVAGIYLPDLLGRQIEPMEALDWIGKLEKKFYDYADGYSAPAIKASDLLEGKSTSVFPDSSYPFSRITADFYDLFPKPIVDSMKMGLKHFSKKIRGFEDGILMGLESRTSSPIQVKRSKEGLIDGFDNLWMAGEGSGYSGGIVSSAADGIRAAVGVAAAD
jgi:uncharacterized FAD-dependent dehydrogenase